MKDQKEHYDKIKKTLSREGGNGNFATFVSIFKTFVGVGILYLPKGYLYGGWLFGEIALLVFAYLTYLGASQLISLRSEYQMSYSSIAERAFGIKFGKLVDTIVFVEQDGAILSYLIFITEHTLELIQYWANYDIIPIWVKLLVGLFYFAVLLPLSFTRNTAKLSWLHVIADVTIIVIILYIGITSGNTLYKVKEIPEGVHAFNGASSMILLGMIAFAFEGIPVIVPLYKQCNDKSQYMSLFRSVIFLVCAIYVIFAHLCYLAYGNGTKSMITMNLPSSSILVQLILISYVIILVPSILIQFFPACRVIEQRYIDSNFNDEKKRNIVVNLFRGSLLALNIFLAIMFGDKFDLILSLIGSLTCSLGTSIPGVMHLKLQATSKLDKFIDILLISIGVIISIITTVISIYKYITL